MKRFILCLAVAMVAAAFLCASSFAAVEGSKHDMVAMGSAYTALVGSYGVCSACHVPHKAGGAKLWSKPQTATAVSFGSLGPLCGSCHDGSLVSGNGADMLQTVYSNISGGIRGHGLSGTAAAGIRNGGTITTETTGLASVTASGLPYTATLADGTYMECVSCHSVHNQYGVRPLLNTKTAAPAVTGMNDICQACHPGRESILMGTANTYGIHPSSSTGSVAGDNTAAGNSPIRAWSSFMVSSQTGTSAAGDPSWLAGPHLAAGGTDNGVSCNSCHMVHGTGDTATTQMTTLPYGSAVLAFNPTSGAANEFCEACHRGSQGTSTHWPNPGAATAVFHPADDDATNGTGRIVAITQPAGWTFGPGTPAEVQCTTCHGVHNNTPEGLTFASTAALRKSGPGNATQQTNYCMACHDSTNSQFDCFHLGHIQTGPAPAGKGGAYSSMTAPTWAGAAIGAAGSGTNLDCYVCHRAHNGISTAMVRAAFSKVSSASIANPDQVCVDCHTVNPSVYTTAFAGDNTNIGSHFVGLPTTATGTVGFASNGFGMSDIAFSAQRTAKFLGGSTSDYVPVYGSAAPGSKGIVGCLSCHATGKQCGTISTTTGTMLRTGDGGTTNGSYMIMSVSGNAVDGYGTDNNARSTGDTVTPRDYLCAGCHGGDAFVKKGSSDTAGKTHPTLDADGTGITPASGFRGSKTTNNKINCESCHRAHDASTKSGTYILENNTGDNVVVNTNDNPRLVEPSHRHNRFCSSCHTDK